MSLNHHILTKLATDGILHKFKKAEWTCGDGGYGMYFYRVDNSANFPSPDATFYDSKNKIVVSFEFKPPTETKRGILTGIGQCIAYLQESDISYLIAPKILEDFQLGNYLNELFSNQISSVIPTGLILYDNNDPYQVTLAQNVEKLRGTEIKRRIPRGGRFWAKHQDLPVPLFHLILHYYYLKKVHRIESDPFATCWLERIISPTVLEDFKTSPILDLSNNVIKTVAGTKPMIVLEKTIPGLKGSHDEKRQKLEQRINTLSSGDNLYQSTKKNFVSFLRNLRMIDSENCITESGFKLYNLGLINGPTSKIFTDYFTKELLTIGHHLDLILDFDTLKQKENSADIREITNLMETEYERKGYIERNPNRKRGDDSDVKFLKYERIYGKH